MDIKKMNEIQTSSAYPTFSLKLKNKDTFYMDVQFSATCNGVCFVSDENEKGQNVFNCYLSDEPKLIPAGSVINAVSDCTVTITEIDHSHELQYERTRRLVEKNNLLKPRVLECIKHLAFKHGPTNNHPKGIMINITKLKVAEMVGCSREMIGRIFEELENEGLISHEKRGRNKHKVGGLVFFREAPKF